VVGFQLRKHFDFDIKCFSYFKIQYNGSFQICELIKNLFVNPIISHEIKKNLLYIRFINIILCLTMKNGKDFLFHRRLCGFGLVIYMPKKCFFKSNCQTNLVLIELFRNQVYTAHRGNCKSHGTLKRMVIPSLYQA